MKKNLVLLLTLILGAFFCSCKKAASIISFTASADSIVQGGLVDLCYELIDAETVRIEPSISEDLAEKNKGCVNVTPLKTTTYKLAAKGPNGQIISKELVVNVEEPPPIAAIKLFETRRANPEDKSPKSPVDLCYEVEGATKIEIDQEVGSVDPLNKGCRTVNPEKTTTYVLTAIGSDNRPVTQETRVQVVHPLAKITQFDVTPRSVNRGDSFKVCYRVEDAKSARIENFSSDVKIGAYCYTGTANRSTTFTLIANNVDYQSNKSETIALTVIQPPVKIVNFTSSSDVVETDSSLTLSFKVENASRITLSSGNHSVDVTGKNPYTLKLRNSTNFKLTAVNFDGTKTDTREKTIKVIAPQQAKILGFESNSYKIMKGKTVSLKYGVTPESRVSIEPGFPNLPASYNKTIAVSPKETTIYTITAIGQNNQPDIKQLKIEVVESPAQVSFTPTSQNINLGATARLCYTIRNATKARIDPGFPAGIEFDTSQRCLFVAPTQRTIYTLTAIGSNGKQVQRQVVINVLPPR